MKSIKKAVEIHFKNNQVFDIDYKPEDIRLDVIDCIELYNVPMNLFFSQLAEAMVALKAKYVDSSNLVFGHYGERQGLGTENLFVFAYKLYSVKEKREIVMLPKYMASLVTGPAPDIKERQETSMHLFVDVLKEMANDESELCKKNNRSWLAKDMFASHPKVHRGYYHHKHEGVLYVIDAVSGDKIRKDESCLTTEGTFIHKSRTEHSNFQQMSHSTRNRLIAVGRASVPVNDPILSSLYFYEPGSHLYIKYKAEQWKIALTMPRALRSICQLWSAYCAYSGSQTLPESVDDIVGAWTAFLGFAGRNRTQEEQLYECLRLTLEATGNNFYIVPKDSPLFPGMVLEDGDRLGQMIAQNPYGSRKPVICLNQEMRVFWDAGNLGPNRAIVPVSLGTFPFDICVNVTAQQTISSSTNQQTRNNYGELLQHSARVNEVKVCFMMTDAEKKVFDYKENQLKEALATHKANRTKALAEGKPFIEAAPRRATEDEPIFLGMELEVLLKSALQNSASMKSLIKEIADSKVGNHVITKADGSIGSYGIEIVTIPATLKYHKDILDKHFFSPPNEFNRRLMAADTCGIHVHISKKSLTTQKLGQLMAFINNNKNGSFINALAGRAPNNYCVRSAVLGNNTKGVDVSAKVVKKACKDGDIKKGLAFRRIEGASHYDAVNIQNANTVEIRIFKSSTDKHRIFRILEFCESLVKFVRCHGMQQMTVYDYVQFLLRKENQEDYHHMILWLASKNMIGHTTKYAKDPKTGELRKKLIHVYGENLIPFPSSLFHANKENYPEYYAKLNKSTTKTKEKEA